MSALSYVKNPPDDNCSICLNSLHGSDDEGKTQQVVAHLNDGELVHHIHKNCLIPWVRIHSTCPICRDPLDERSLLTVAEKLAEKFGSLLQNLKEAGDRIAAAERTPELAGRLVGSVILAIMVIKSGPFPGSFAWEVERQILFWRASA